mgnify:CR=1 FL=1
MNTIDIPSVSLVLDIAEQVDNIRLSFCIYSSQILSIPRQRTGTITRLELSDCNHRLWLSALWLVFEDKRGAFAYPLRPCLPPEKILVH